MKHPVYLDYAAATPVDDSVLAAMMPYFAKTFYNPSATYLAARAVADDLQAARSKVAYWLGARPNEVLFTAGGTEANNLAIDGVMRQYPQANIVVSSIEHDSVLAPAGQYTMRKVPVTHEGLIDLVKLEEAIDLKTALVSVMYANNEIGTIQPIREIMDIISRKRKQRLGHTLPLLFHTDAAQAGAYLDLHLHRLGVDLITLNGGKIYGPKQSGALIIKAGTILKPLLLGGGQEWGLRSGTENVAGSIGFAAALDLVQSRRKAEIERLQHLQSLFYQLLERELPSAVVNGSRDHRLPNNVHVTFPGHDNERLMIQLDEAGIICAAGSACSASSEEPSHVLRAIGLSVADAQASLRFTMGIGTGEADIQATVRALSKLLSVTEV
jgi:cysteine desulfurase